jgi:hypothetical protein
MALASFLFGDGANFTGGAATNTIGPFVVLGGKYGFGAYDTGGAMAATLNMYTPAGNTIPLGSISTSTPFVVVDLPAGKLSISLTGGTTVDGFLVLVPHRGP